MMEYMIVEEYSFDLPFRSTCPAYCYTIIIRNMY